MRLKGTLPASDMGLSEAPYFDESFTSCLTPPNFA
jgi:hypothetical protein